jgi:hypothetical protein
VNVTFDDFKNVKGRGNLKNVLFNEKHKIMMCPIQKVASTEWTKFFKRLAGDKHYHADTPFNTKQGPPIKLSDNLVHDNENPEKAALWLRKVNDALHDPSWTRAIFFRDPARRLLSAFLMLFGPNTFTNKDDCYRQKRPKRCDITKVQLRRYRQQFGLEDDVTYLVPLPPPPSLHPPSLSLPPSLNLSMPLFFSLGEAVCTLLTCGEGGK